MIASGHTVSEFQSSLVDSDFIDDKLKNTSIVETTKQDRRKALTDCSAVLFQEIIMNGAKDGKDPFYTNIVCLTDGRVVIVDYNNHICSLYDSCYNHMSDCTTSSQPLGVCTIDTDEVAVALPHEKKIQFLKIGDAIKPTGFKATRRMCMSLVALNKMELVYAGTMRTETTYYWGIITRDGREKSCFHFLHGNYEFATVYIALNSCKTRAYISCHDAGTVFCFGLDGMQHFEYKVQEGPNQGQPNGIALDSEDNVYVAVRNLRSIHRLSSDCRIQTIFKDMIPEFPRTICFKQSGDNFLLTCQCTKTCNICYSYKMK